MPTLGAAGDRVMTRALAIVATLFAGTVVVTTAQYHGWFIPDGGTDEKSPMSSVAGAVTRGTLRK